MENNRLEEIEVREERDFQENLNYITNFLNRFNKDYTVKYWDGANGANIIVHCLDFDGEEFGADGKPYDQIISLNYSGYLDFGKQEMEEKE